MGFLTFLKNLFHDPDERPIRGRFLLSYEEARKRAEKVNGSRLGEWDLGCVPHPLSAAKTHTALVGTSGSGKTTLMKRIMRQLCSLVYTRPFTKALINDAKNDVLSYLFSLGLHFRTIIADPFDTRGRAWDMAADLDSPALALEGATILIPDGRGSDNQYFVLGARDLVRHIILVFNELCPGRWQFRDVILAASDVDTLEHVLSQTETGKRAIKKYFKKQTNIDGLVSTLGTHLCAHEAAAACWSRASRSFSVKRWIGSGDILVLPNHEEFQESCNAINRIVIARASQLLLKHLDESAMSVLLLDEVRELGSGIDQYLRPLINKGRQYGVSLFLGFQSEIGLESALGEKESRELVGMCSNRCFLRLGDESAEWASKLLGDQEVWIRERTTNYGGGSTTTSESWKRVTRPAVLPSEFSTLALPDLRGGVDYIDGIFDFARVGTWKVRTPFSLWPSFPTEEERRAFPDFSPRPKGHQVLESWSESDYRRLSLPPLTVSLKDKLRKKRKP